jgi:orotidine-5'-phosphate decarboxylase
MTKFIDNPVFCALDMPDVGVALEQAKKLNGLIGGIKLGLEFFLANGPQALDNMSKAGHPIFLDLKLHDIPNTVAGAVRSLAPLGVDILTIHTQGGPNMMSAAVDSAHDEAAKLGLTPPKIIGVTILTSLDVDDLSKMGVYQSVEDQVLNLATLAKASGLDGIVCSPLEIASIRAELGDEFMLVVPGIRLAGSKAGDQKRVLSPSEAVAAGADILVIGRPITQAENIEAAALAIKDSLNL